MPPPVSITPTRGQPSRTWLLATLTSVVGLTALLALRPAEVDAAVEQVSVRAASAAVSLDSTRVGIDKRPTAVGTLEEAGPSSTEQPCHALRLHPNVTDLLIAAYVCGTGCGGRVARLVIKPSAWPAVKPLSAARDTSAYLASRFGPHLFRLRFDGPTAFVLTPVPDEGRKEYRAALPALLPGERYRLAWEQLYTNYAAINELDPQWPPLLKQTLLQLDPTFSTHYHVQQCTLPSVETISCETKAASLVIGESAAAKRCTGHESDGSGVWLRRGQGTVYTRVRVKKIRRDPILFQWALQRDHDWVWQPAVCSIGRVAPDAFLRAFAGKRFLVGGDSQLRALYFGLLNVLRGNEMPCVRNISTVDREPEQCVANVKGSQRYQLQHNVQLDFVDDTFLDRFMGDRYAAYDVIVVGFAQHPASKEHWSIKKFAAAAATKATRARALIDQGKRVVWYGAPQYPHTRQGYPVFVRDWRTDARLTVFNEVAFELMRRAKVPLIDAFNVSTAMGHTSPDQAHYSNFVSAELVHMLLTILCGADGCS